MKPDFNYIPPEKREEVLKKIADDPNAPGARELRNDEVASEIWDDTKDMTAAERFDYLRKRLAREEQVMKQLQKQYEEAVKAAEKK